MMTARETLWHATNDHPRDLMELLEGGLDAGQIDRKWRLFCCACARRALVVSGVKWVEPLLCLSEDFADGRADWDTLFAMRTELWARTPFKGHPIDPPDHAAQSVFGTTYWRRDSSLFEATCSMLDLAAYAGSDEDSEWSLQAAILKDIFGNPFHPITFSPEWRTDTAVSLAQGMYESRDFSAMSILADALQDAGCDNDDILSHCRAGKQVHVRGCGVVDLVLGKE